MHTAAEGQCTAEPPTELLPKDTQEGFSATQKPQSKIRVQERAFNQPRNSHVSLTCFSHISRG